MKTRGRAIRSALLAWAAALATGVSALDAASAQALRPEDAFGPSAKPTASRRAPSHKKKSALTPASSAPSSKASSFLQPVAPAPSAVAAASNTPAQEPAVTSSSYNARHAAALNLALSGQNKGAARALRALLDEKAAESDKDVVRLSLGRVLYATGDLQAAIDAYAGVSRGSDAWILSLEERAWANMRLDRPEDSLASLKTLLLPIFEDRVGSEPYFLASLAYLRVCDYKSVFATIKSFKERFRSRIQEWESSPADPEAQARLKEAGETIQKLSLVEAEAIQRVYMPDEIKGHSGPERKIVRTRDQLKFPEPSAKEVWLDEAEGIQVSVKGCPRRGFVGKGVAGSPDGGKGGRSL